MVNLTTLAPDFAAAILDETLPLNLTLFDLAVDPAALWEEQRPKSFGSRYPGRLTLTYTSMSKKEGAL